MTAVRFPSPPMLQKHNAQLVLNDFSSLKTLSHTTRTGCATLTSVMWYNALQCFTSRINLCTAWGPPGCCWGLLRCRSLPARQGAVVQLQRKSRVISLSILVDWRQNLSLTTLFQMGRKWINSHMWFIVTLKKKKKFNYNLNNTKPHNWLCLNY